MNKKLSFIEGEDLLGRIMHSVKREKRMNQVKRRIVVTSVLLVGSVVSFFPALNYLQSDLKESGFLQFLSLIFSDFDIVMSYWQNFSMLILESLPIISLAILLAIVITFLASIKSLSKNIKYLPKPIKIIN